MKLLLPIVAAALVCTSRDLKDFHLDKLESSYTLQRDLKTPPSEAHESWFFNVCGKAEGTNHNLCPLLAIVCRNAWVLTENSEITTEHMAWLSVKKVEGLAVAKTVHFEDIAWGELQIGLSLSIRCTKGRETLLELATQSLNDSRRNYELTFYTNSCKRDEDTGELWGWFTWIFIFMVLFLSIYVVGGAWFQYSKGNSIDFQSALREVLDNFVDLARGVPAFVREIIEKLTGNSSRGEYSAL